MADSVSQFRFNTWQHLATSSGKYLTDPLAADQAYVDYFDPFNCECRAYGRLQQEGRQDLAVQAHGYLLLTPDQERTITAEIDPGSLEETGPVSPCLDGDGPWGRYEQHRGQLVRAIVKDVAEEKNDSFTAAQVPQLWTDLKALHSLGILVRDIHMGNYLNGKLVDFSLAWTMYHPSLERIDDYDIYTFIRAELINLEQMMYDWWYMNPCVEIEIPKELSSLTVGARAGQIGIDPRKYDWQKWEKDPVTVKNYIAKDLFEPDEDC